jgi:hypothetical protein
MHGKGMMEFPDGSVYEGTFKPTKYFKKNTLHKSTGN